MANILDVLKEELLLEGKSWENLYKNIDKRLKEGIRKKAMQYNLEPIDIVEALKYLDPTATDTNAGKYSQWLINLFSKKRSFLDILATEAQEKQADNYIYNYLKRFDNIQSNLEKKDINQYSDLDEVKQAIDKYESQKSTKKLKGKADKTVEGWSIKKIKNYDQSCNLGKGTKWCITNPEAFANYIERVNLFFLSDGKDKYAITTRKNEDDLKAIVYNKQDDKIGGVDFLKKLPSEIFNYIKKQSS